MSPEDWQAAWGIENLLFVKEEHAAQLPPSAWQFLQTFGWPRWIRFESETVEGNDWGHLEFQILFEQLSRELVPFNKLVTWGDTFDEQQDKAWSKQLVIGEWESCQSRPELCVHQATGTVIEIIECEIEEFVNSSVSQFGESLLSLKQWSSVNRGVPGSTWKTSVLNLSNTLTDLDPEIIKQPKSFWPGLIQWIETSVKPGSAEITITRGPSLY